VSRDVSELRRCQGRGGVSACEDTDLHSSVYVCRVYRRACVCMCVHVFFFSCVGISVRVYVCVHACVRGVGMRECTHSCVRSSVCVWCDGRR
jgi:hypothetical protein